MCSSDQSSPPRISLPEPLPMSRQDMDRRGWDALDILLVTGDAYVDHPAWGVALLGRLLEAEGWRVGVLARPSWDSSRPPGAEWTDMGRPLLFAGVTAGCVDSMLSLYTAARRVRRDDPYAPGGRSDPTPGDPGRPKRAVIVYTNLVRRLFPGLPVVIGGIEASLRRLAHYDYWTDRVRRSVLLDSKADLLVYGMGERPIVEIARRLRVGEPLDGIRGTVQALRPEAASDLVGPEAVRLPSFEEVASDKEAFMRAALENERRQNPWCGAPLLQRHGDREVVVHPPSLPLASEELDRIYEQPFTRRPHPAYTQAVPALESVRHSIVVVRGCFGGCAFCALGSHQGKFIQSRSKASVLREARRLIQSSDFRGTISDLGGPTANMYALGCSSDKASSKCQRPSCLYPNVCPSLNTNHRAQIELLRAVRELPGVKHVFIGSGIRHDLALLDIKYLEELTRHHVSGHLKIAPEHATPSVLRLMRKPPFEVFDQFCETFERISKSAGKEQYVLPYFIAGHPGADPEAAEGLRRVLRERGLRVEQAQEFIPSPMTLSTAQYYTGLDPESLCPIPVPQSDRARRAEKNAITGGVGGRHQKKGAPTRAKGKPRNRR